MENSLKKGYNIVFLIKKDINSKEIDFRKIEEDMNKILEKAEIIVMDKK